VPSPIGHVLGGIAAGWIVAGVPAGEQGGRGRTDRAWREAALFGALGALPDVDLLFGAHSGPTHSVGAAALAGIVVGLVAVRHRLLAPATRAVTAIAACAAAYGSHVLLDWLARDTTAPIGVMALWPFQREHYESNLHLFMAISRRYYQGWTFVRQNGLALLRELALLVPILVLVIVLRPRAPRRRVQE
jgi:inner membrane protein